MEFNETKDAAKRLQTDAQSSAGEFKSVAQDFWAGVARRFGLAGADAQRLVTDGSAYIQEWTALVKEDLGREVKTTATNAIMSVFGLFVASLGFLLLNMGAIWGLSNANVEVGRWFAIFGAGWILIGGVLGAIAFAREKRAIQDTTANIRQDAQVPQRHIKEVYQRFQEHRNESTTTHGHA
jgi:hypothetical protein